MPLTPPRTAFLFLACLCPGVLTPGSLASLARGYRRKGLTLQNHTSYGDTKQKDHFSSFQQLRSSGLGKTTEGFGG